MNEPMIDPPLKRLLETPKIIERIMTHTPYGLAEAQHKCCSDNEFQEHLNYRLVNKRFATAITQQLRKNNEKLVVQSVFIKHYYQVNYKELHRSNLIKYLKFLQNIGTQFEEIIADSEWRGSKIFRIEEIHAQLISMITSNEKLNKLPRRIFGLETLCNGCENCFKYAKICSEHSFFSIRKIHAKVWEPQHFQTLRVDLPTLINLAKQTLCILSEPKESSQKLMIPDVTCDVLVFHLGLLVREGEYPYEPIIVYIEKWKPKSVVFQTASHLYAYWNLNESKNFNEFSILNDIPGDRRLTNVLESMKIDLEDRRCFPGNYENLAIASMHRIFGPRKMEICNLPLPDIASINSFISSILRSVDNCMHQYPLDLTIFSKVDDCLMDDDVPIPTDSHASLGQWMLSCHESSPARCDGNMWQQVVFNFSNPNHNHKMTLKMMLCVEDLRDYFKSLSESSNPEFLSNFKHLI